MKNFISALLLAFTIAIFSNGVSGAWGDFDSTFGFLGASFDNVADHYPRAVAVQPDGKILVTGYRWVGRQRLFVRRYLSNGQLDTSFGNNGAAASNAPINANADYSGAQIIVQDDGRIAVAGGGDGHAVIWRFLPSGAADTSIGSGGMKSLVGYGNFLDAKIATYANILYVGVSLDASPSTVILKFNSNGSKDTSFGMSGEAITDANRFFSIATDPTTGNILISGRRRSDPNDYGVERFLPSGVLDPSFTHWGAAYGGHITSNPSSFLRLSAGTFVLNERWTTPWGGSVRLGANIVRLNASGAFTSRTSYEPDTSVPGGGPAGPCPELMAQQQDGKLVLKGANSDELFRFSTNFASVQTMSCSSFTQLANKSHAVLQPDDKMIVAGTYGGVITIVRTLP